MNSRYWTLAKRPPPPWPDEATFALKEAPVPTPGPGQALTRTIYVSLDPYQWGYKRRGEEPEGAPCHARSVSQIVESRIDGLAAGDFVFNTNGWAEYGLMGEGVPRPGYMVPRKLDPARGKISHAVGVLGMLGLTAYAGMVLQCEPKPGETAVVSAASGGVGQIAGQIARLKGCRMVGIAGRDGEVSLCGGGARLPRLYLAPVTEFCSGPEGCLPGRHRHLFRKCRRDGV